MAGYVPSSAAERAEMLSSMGYTHLDELYANVPHSLLHPTLNVPEALSELEVRNHMEELAAQNTVFSSIYRGAGAYWHYIPAMVGNVVGKEAFQTAYTPYQAEISQGVLQSIFEFQTMVCQLTGMDVANASMYDGASTAAEAIFMCTDRKHTRVVVSAGVHPHTIEVIQTYCHARNITVDIVDLTEGVTSPDALRQALGDTSDVACSIIQQPNFYGQLEDASTLIEATHEAGARSIMAVEPLSLGVLASPGELGADICVAEGQPLGLPLAFGGPYLGIMACTQKLMRKLPGRIAGQTTDADGNRVFVLTLQAREQHIRREKASSNVCSNQALCALAASVYLSSMGPSGIQRVAESGLAYAHYLADKLCEIPGFELAFEGTFFNEFVTTCPIDPHTLERALAEKGMLCGLPIALDKEANATHILWCATELTTPARIDTLVECIAHVVHEGGVA